MVNVLYTMLLAVLEQAKGTPAAAAETLRDAAESTRLFEMEAPSHANQ